MDIVTDKQEKQSLRDYQATILARLEEAKQADVSVDSSYLGVIIANESYLIYMRDVKEALPILDTYPVPMVKPWFMGMANVRGVLYAVNDTGRLMNNSASVQTSSSRFLLLSDDVMPHVAILVDKLIGIRKLEQMQVLENVTLDEQTHEFVGNIYIDQEQKKWKVLDCTRLVQSKAFAQLY